MKSFRSAVLASAIVACSIGVGLAGRPQQTREPASRAAVVLTWDQAQREAGFASMDKIFMTRTVRAGGRPRPLPDGKPLPFAPGGPRAAEFDRFVTEQKVAGVLVLHDGAVRLERYALSGGRDVRWHSFSIAKSITSTLAGAAMRDGSIRSLDDPVTRYITDLRGSPYDEVTVRQLLTMTSGVRWNEDYTDLESDVARMYAVPPEPGLDMTVSYVRKLPREAAPGTKWVYKTSETNLVGVLVMAATRKPLADYLSEKIWRPYGMERDAEWMLDDIGHEQGGCCLAMTLRDLGRFGQFIVDGAKVDNVPVVTDTWLQEATRAHVSTGGAGSGYGYQWWTRPEGAFEGRGIYGQTLHIDPKRRLVIAIDSAAQQPTGGGQGQARQDFIAAVKAAIDREQTSAQSVQYRSPAGVEYRSLPDTDAVKTARAALAADPKNVARIIDLGVAQSGARQFREAIATFTRGLEIEPDNALLLRWRGHRYLSVREFDRAFDDLARGGKLDPSIYGIWYHLGVIQFVRGEFAAAAKSFATAQPIAPDAGELAGSTDWLWMSLSRAGRGAEAKAMLDRRPDNKPVTNAYTRRLQLYRGEIGPDAVVTAADTDDVQVATLAYGLGNWYLLRGDTAQARTWFERSVQSGGWPAFGFIASEAELRRSR